jgi:hypothetical protein
MIGAIGKLPRPEHACVEWPDSSLSRSFSICFFAVKKFHPFNFHAGPSPACGLARYPPSLFLEKLALHENAYKIIQGILFYRRPVAFAAVLALTELAFFFVSAFNLGFFSVAAVALALAHAVPFVARRWGPDFAAVCFPPIEEGAAPVPNRVYPLLPFCEWLSHISSTVADAAARAGAVARPAAALLGEAAALLFFWAVGTFWPVFAAVHVALLAPGIAMHPRVFPYTQPYILRFARAIKCPYCG